MTLFTKLKEGKFPSSLQKEVIAKFESGLEDNEKWFLAGLYIGQNIERFENCEPELNNNGGLDKEEYDRQCCTILQEAIEKVNNLRKL